MNNLKSKIEWLFVTHLGRILLGVALIIFGGFMAGTFKQEWNGYLYIMVVGIFLLVIQFVIMMVYAIMNAYNDSWAKRKKKK